MLNSRDAANTQDTGVPKDNQDVIDKIIRLHSYVLEQYDDRLEAIYKNNAIVLGDQWDEELKAKLQSQGRPTYCLNIELSFVMQLLGMQKRQARSWKVVPVDDSGDDTVAEVLKKLLLQIANDNDLDYIDEQVFEAGVIGCVGWYYVDMDYDEDPRGTIKIYIEDNTMVFPDPDAKMDNQQDWGYVIKTSWMTWDKIRKTWGDKVLSTPPELSVLSRWWELLRERLPAALRGRVKEELVDHVNNLYRVIDLWEREYRDVRIVQDPASGSLHNVVNREAAEILVQRGWIPISFGKRPYLRLTTVLPHTDTVLEERLVNRRYFPFAGFYPMKFAGLPLVDCISYVENLHGVQDAININSSVVSDTLQRSVNGGILVGPGESALKRDLIERGSEPGYVGIKATNLNIERLQQDFPSGTYQFLQMNEMYAQRISGQPLAQRGESESSEESGTLFRAKVQQGITTLAPIFSAFSRTRRLLAKIIMEFIQSEYTQERVVRIIGDKNESLQINTRDPYAIERVLNDVTIGKYDVVIEDEPHIKAQRQDELRSLSEIIKVMPPEMVALIAPEIIENTDLPNRRELAERMRGIIGAAKPAGMNQNPQQSPPMGAGLS
mgnify:CR=1 FL=1